MEVTVQLSLVLFVILIMIGKITNDKKIEKITGSKNEERSLHTKSVAVTAIKKRSM